MGNLDVWTIYDHEKDMEIADCHTRGDAQHIVHALNAVHAMIASVEAIGLER